MKALEEALYKLLSQSSSLATLLPGNRHIVTVSDATGGTFKLSYQGQTTAAIAYNATAAAVQTALAALTTVGTGNVAVTGNAGGPWTVTFVGTLLDGTAALTADGTLLEGTGATITALHCAAVYNGTAISPPAAYATFQLIAGGSEYAYRATRASRRYRYQVTVFSTGPNRSTIADAMDAIETLLDMQTLTVGTQNVWGITKASENPSGAAEDGGLLWQWASADYYVDLGG